MRSELVIAATPAVRNRFVLVHVACKLTRAFHRPTKDRVQDSINAAMAGLGEGKFCVWRSDRREQWRIFDGQPKPDDALIALTTLTTGVPYFPPQSAPAETAQAAERA